MIARVAESCFWLHRYIERVDNTARLIGVNFAFLLDVRPEVAARWKPLIVVSGEEDDFVEKVGAEFVEDGDKVQEFLVWSEDNPVSIRTSLDWARENARTIRETLSIEGWSVINRFWLWLKSNEANGLYISQPAVFYERIREHCQLFHGVCHDTLLHEEPFEFMRLGMFLERASQVARILDTKYHAVGPTTGESESPVELAEWIAILRSCSAYEPFFKRANAPLSGQAVADFLLFDPAFPRSVMHCLLRARNFFELISRRIEGAAETRAPFMLRELLARLQTRSIEGILEDGLHDEITEIVNRLAEVCAAVRDDYFSTVIPEEAQPTPSLGNA